MAILIDHLREALGDDSHDALSRVDKAMAPPAMATYAFVHGDRARATLGQGVELG